MAGLLLPEELRFSAPGFHRPPAHDRPRSWDRIGDIVSHAEQVGVASAQAARHCLDFTHEIIDVERSDRAIFHDDAPVDVSTLAPVSANTIWLTTSLTGTHHGASRR